MPESGRQSLIRNPETSEVRGRFQGSSLLSRFQPVSGFKMWNGGPNSDSDPLRKGLNGFGTYFPCGLRN